MELYKADIKAIKNALSRVIKEEMSVAPKRIKYLGGGSFGKVFKAEAADGKEICLKIYRDKGMNESEAEQLRLLASHTQVKMPEVLFTSEASGSGVLAMSYIEGKNVLNPLFLFKSRLQKARFAEAVVDGLLQWHEVSSPRFGAFDNPQIDNWYEYYRTEKAQRLLTFLSKKAEENKFSKKSLRFSQRAWKYMTKSVTSLSAAFWFTAI